MQKAAAAAAADTLYLFTCRRITTITEDTRETTFLFQRCKEELRFLSTTPWSQSKLPLQP